MISDTEQVRERVIELEVEHRDLDVAIGRLDETANCDELQLRRLKKRRLHLKDQILRLRMQLVPDIPA
jgi:hypothetical protein